MRVLLLSSLLISLASLSAHAQRADGPKQTVKRQTVSCDGGTVADHGCHHSQPPQTFPAAPK